MKIYIAKDECEARYFSVLRKAQRFSSDIEVIDLDIDSLPHEGCTRKDLEFWSDAIDLWLVD